ncbi:MAG: B12-binding domain-containing radical SAM protein [Cyclobacteriaceae bacterium]|nr:B12-binding domain-containing radical SAM protein [Cyclobacteriaceae bacterium]
MKLLFTHSYFYRLDAKQWANRQPYPPLGTLQVAAVAREIGFPVALFDTALRESPQEIRTVLEAERPDCVVIYDDGFNYLTKMCLTVMREAAFRLAEISKQHGCTVIICSSDSTDHYEKYFSHGVDYVVRGEGEETLKELLIALDKKDRATRLISGVAFQENGETIVTPSRPVMRDLNALPMPAWDLLEVSPYRNIWLKHHGYFSLNIATTRGCPFKCNWCAKPIYGNRYNSRSPEHVVNEIEYLLTTYQPDHFWMCDDIFGLKPGWVKQFKNLVKERGLTFKYKIQSRVDLLLEEDTIQALADSGAKTVWVGAESGSQKILDAMDKGTTIAQIQQATRLLQQKGIRAAFFLQFGYPGETKKDIDATIQMLLELMPDEIGISVSYPLPGTPFHEKVKADLHKKQNWSDSDDLAMMFRSTFPPHYYKILHRYVHCRYRIQRGINYLKAYKFYKLRALASMVVNSFLSVVHSYRLHRLEHATA